MPIFARAGFFSFAALSAALLFACNTTSSGGGEFDVAPGLVYDGTTHTPTQSGICGHDSSYLAFWDLSYQAGGTTITSRTLDVNVGLASYDGVGAPPVSSGIYDVAGHNTSPTEMAGEASLILWDWDNVPGNQVSGSPASSTAKIQITVFGDSVRFVGKNIALENGKLISFNLKTLNDCSL